MVAMPRNARLLVAAIAVVFSVAGCAGTGNVNTSVATSLGFQYGGSGAYIYKTGHRELAGNVSGTTLQGQPLSLASFRGKYVVINFWSYDCGPCHAEEQGFEALATEDASKGVRFLGIDERDNRDAALSFERQYHVTYPSLYDRTDAFTLDFPGATPSTTPFTIILDPQGRIAAKAPDSMDYTHLKELINAVRSEST
jgi:thiol-disulfide isomerase/thioredoxin